MVTSLHESESLPRTGRRSPVQQLFGICVSPGGSLEVSRSCRWTTEQTFSDFGDVTVEVVPNVSRSSEKNKQAPPIGFGIIAISGRFAARIACGKLKVEFELRCSVRRMSRYHRGSVFQLPRRRNVSQQSYFWVGRTCTTSIYLEEFPNEMERLGKAGKNPEK